MRARGAILLAMAAMAAVPRMARAQGVPPYDTSLLNAPAAAPPAATTPTPAPAQPDAAAPQSPPALSPPPGNLAAPGIASAGPGATAPEQPPHPDTIVGLLGAARQDAAAGELPDASELVEEAETRLLDRSVEVGTNSQPIETPMIQALADARRALDAGQQAQGVRLLDDAIAHLPPIVPAQ